MDQEPPSQIRRIKITLPYLVLHYQKFRHPIPWPIAIMKALTTGKPGQFHFNQSALIKNAGREREVVYDFPAEVVRQIEEAKKAGYEYELVPSANGVDIYAGKDTVEHAQAQENKRWKKLDRHLH